MYRILLLIPCSFAYAIYLPTNALNKIQQTANHTTQFVIRVTPTDGILVNRNFVL